MEDESSSESTVTSPTSAMMCIFPGTFMTLRNGLRPVKDSLTVPLYCRADLRLAQTLSLESSTVSIKCYDRFFECLLNIVKYSPSVLETAVVLCFFTDNRPSMEQYLSCIDFKQNRSSSQHHITPSVLSFSSLVQRYCEFICVKLTHLHAEGTRLFISLFISIISRNYNSVLSGSAELESKCFLLAGSYISHSRRRRRRRVHE